MTQSGEMSDEAYEAFEDQLIDGALRMVRPSVLGRVVDDDGVPCGEQLVATVVSSTLSQLHVRGYRIVRP